MGILDNIRERMKNRKLSRLVSKGKSGIEQILQLDGVTRRDLLIKNSGNLSESMIVRIINSLDDSYERTYLLENFKSVLSQEMVASIIKELPDLNKASKLIEYKDDLSPDIIAEIISSTDANSHYRERLVLEFKEILDTQHLYLFINSISEPAVLQLLTECKEKMAKDREALTLVIKNTLSSIYQERVLMEYKDVLNSNSIHEILQTFPEQDRVRLLELFEDKLGSQQISAMIAAVSSKYKDELIIRYYKSHSLHNISELLNNVSESEKTEIIKQIAPKIYHIPGGNHDLYNYIMNAGNKKELLEICSSMHCLDLKQIIEVLKTIPQEEQYEFLKNNKIGFATGTIDIIKEMPGDKQIELAKGYLEYTSYSPKEALKVIFDVSPDVALEMFCEKNISLGMYNEIFGESLSNIKNRSGIFAKLEQKYKELCQEERVDLKQIIEEQYEIDTLELLKIRALFSSGILSKEQEEKLINKLQKTKQGSELDADYVEKMVSDFINGTMDIDSFINIMDKKDIKAYEFFGALHNGFADIPDDFMELSNIKHVRQIYNQLIEKGIDAQQIEKVTTTMYSVLGFENSMEILQDKYGEISATTLTQLFATGYDLDEVIYEPDGKGFKPKLNEKFVNLFMGQSYKVADTPLRNLLEGKATDKQKEFLEHIAEVYSNWDVVEEEFARKKNSSNLKLKLNIGTINEIIANLSEVILDPKDYKLAQTDILQFAGKDTQFAMGKSQKEVVARAVTLSRGMEQVRTKKFPHTKVEKDGSQLEVFHPQDRNILTMGYKSRCCFRPYGNADGNDVSMSASLVKYCTSTEYAGGIVIKDEKGDVEAFSPILRNGNVLIIHSIETKDEEVIHVGSEKNKRVHELMTKFGEEQIRISQEQEGEAGIKFVVLGQLHHTDEAFSKGTLQRIVSYYDQSGEYEKMYTNLDCPQIVIAMQEGASIEDIRLGEVQTSYEYDRPEVKKISIRKEDSEKIEKCKKTKAEIVRLTSELEELTPEERQSRLAEIAKLKQEYLADFSEVVGSISDNDRMRAVMGIIDELSGRKPKTIEETTLFMYNDDWYIACNAKGEMASNCLETGREECGEFIQKQRALLPKEKGMHDGGEITAGDFRDATEQVTASEIGAVVAETNKALEQVQNRER